MMGLVFYDQTDIRTSKEILIHKLGREEISLKKHQFSPVNLGSDIIHRFQKRIR
jgi:hypothetical protein